MNRLADIRLSIFRGIVFTVIAGLAAALYYFQVLHGSYYRRLSEKNRIRLIRVEAPRGAVLDRNGVALAKTRASLDVFVIPEDFNSEYTAFLAAVLEIPRQDIEQKLKNLRDAPFVPVLLKKDVTKEVVFRIEEKRPGLSGVYAVIQGLRYYPEGKAVSHVLGYLGKITQEEYAALGAEGYHFDDWIGRSGIEKIYDRRLHGEDGGRQVEVNVRGRQVRVLGEKEAVGGETVALTIDLRVQKLISQAFGEKKGAACILDIETGEVLALVSKPDFDPNVFVSPSRGAERMRVVLDRTQLPLLNRGAGAGFPPGSVFKLVSAIAGLETGKITPSTTFFCHGSYRLRPNSRAFKCWNPNGHGYVNLTQAIERSCNVYFYQVGARVGVENLSKYSHKLGLGEFMDIEQTNLSEGLIPDTAWKRARFQDDWYQGETLNFAIGQGYVLTTPLQLAQLSAIIARDGVIPEVHIVRDPHRKRSVRNAGIRPRTIELVKKGMLQVVQSDRGTGKLARVDFVRVAAKTGTAQVPPNEPHAWFSGFFPFDRPKYALVVFIEHGGAGGLHAGRLAKEILLGMKGLGFFGEAAPAGEVVAHA
ncbi:MAG: penicillin-binding protein 2 [Candidatus Omnitrophica bacterium]|nr:penicillin-binding protein 2 [Candidatus Omnitrophota bacterium]